MFGNVKVEKYGSIASDGQMVAYNPNQGVNMAAHNGQELER